jgi:hypothetical protein
VGLIEVLCEGGMDSLDDSNKSSDLMKDGSLHSLTERISILRKGSALSWLFNDAVSIEILMNMDKLVELLLLHLYIFFIKDILSAA